MSLQKIDESQNLVSPQEFDLSLQWAHQKAKSSRRLWTRRSSP